MARDLWAIVTATGTNWMVAASVVATVVHRVNTVMSVGCVVAPVIALSNYGCGQLKSTNIAK